MPSVGSNSPQAKLNNAWKAWTNFWAKHSGVWKKPLSVHVRQNGNWVKVWDERPVLSINSNSYSYSYEIIGNNYWVTTYYRTDFTVTANGFSTTISTLPNSATVYMTEPASAGKTVSGYVIAAYGQWNNQYPNQDIYYAQITASNASGIVTKKYYN